MILAGEIPEAFLEPDVVIVGAGAVGVVLAVQSRKRVILLEIGLLGVVVFDERIIARDTSNLDDRRDGYHHMGGARMSLHSADGVVEIAC